MFREYVNLKGINKREDQGDVDCMQAAKTPM